MYSVEQATRAYAILEVMRSKVARDSAEWAHLDGQMAVFGAIASNEQTPGEIDAALSEKEEKWGNL